MLEYNSGMVTTTTHLTYDDLRQIRPDRNRYELIEGELFVSPAPSFEHQRKTLRLARKLADHVEQHDLSEVFIAPCDVVLAPSMASDSSCTMDRFVKRDRYAEFGVPEYWLLDPFEAAYRGPPA